MHGMLSLSIIVPVDAAASEEHLTRAKSGYGTLWAPLDSIKRPIVFWCFLSPNRFTAQPSHSTIMRFSSVVTALVIGAASANALGVNCRGSSLCGQAGATLGQLANVINNGINDGGQYGDGTQIACSMHLCAFFQNTGTSNSGATAKRLVQGLIDHGCERCGSNPTDGGNVDNGQLTVNYVNNPVCQGVC
ncbi:killer kp4 [Moniliophthora roreri MCA 2997]|uniref:Killer kp4 n=2 Tax=Moniliophthora roreri TaxID=221103 RepID=V2XPS0_MONRO|nr:killer kp4 [Moniliophthora roreri MCA 2997]KAI3616138.1 killer kp4 [Moniliophthora roreri]